MKPYQIVPTTDEHIASFNFALGSVARERKYLAMLGEPPLEMSREFILRGIRENWPHFVAISEGNVIGWCNITSQLYRPLIAHVGILGLGVLAAYRGQGIGESLMRDTLENAKTIGLTRVELAVREHNKPAIALYKKFGFVEEGFHRNAVRMDNVYENEISMALLFE